MRLATQRSTTAQAAVRYRRVVRLSNEHGGWLFRRLSPQLLTCTRHHAPTPRTVHVDATGPFSYIACVDRHEGQIAYLVDGVEIAAPARHVVVLPAFSLVRSVFVQVRVQTEVFISRVPLPLPWTAPMMFSTQATADVATVARAAAGAANDHLVELLRCAAPRAIGADHAARALVKRAKAELDHGYGETVQIASVASALGMSPAALSRAFRADLGITPLQYRTLMRVTAAAMKLLDGDDVAQTAFDVGFGDLGRFYKAFRETTRVTPAQFRVRDASESTPPPRPATRHRRREQGDQTRLR